MCDCEPRRVVIDGVEYSPKEDDFDLSDYVWDNFMAVLSEVADSVLEAKTDDTFAAKVADFLDSSIAVEGTDLIKAWADRTEEMNDDPTSEDYEKYKDIVALIREFHAKFTEIYKRPTLDGEADATL